MVLEDAHRMDPISKSKLEAYTDKKQFSKNPFAQ